MTPDIKCLFLDIGGVLLTNGWDHDIRKHVAKHFNIESTDMEYRHHLTFGTYEEGKISLEEYLNRVVFYKPRPFTQAEFQRFMFDQSKPFPEMIDLISRLKAKYGLKITVVSNEGRSLNEYRIRKYRLDQLVDTFISSCYIRVRKPDTQIFQLAIDISQVSPENVVYIENTEMFVQIAQGLGIRCILHTGYASTYEALSSFGLMEN